MTIKARLLLCAMAVLATMSMVDCNEYSCGGFGSLPCTAGSGGSGSGSFGGGGGGSSTATAFAFAVDQGGTVDGYTLSSSTFAATTSFVAPATSITANPGAGMVVVQQSGQQPFVYAVFGPPNGELFGWSVSTSGALTLLSNLPAPLSLIPDVSIPFNQYNIATNPAGTLLFIADSFDNQIFVFQIATTGALTAVTGSPFPTPVNPGNLTTDGLGKYLYVTETLLDHTGAEVLGYSIGDGTTNPLGVLTELSSSPFAFNMWQLQGDATGNYLVGTTGNSAAPGFGLSNSDDLHLYVFSIQQTASTTPAGTLTEVGTGFATTYSPLNIAMQPPSSGGEFVYSFSVNDSGAAYNPIEGYQLVTSGAQATLTPISGFPTSGIATGHWGQFDQSGAILFVYSSISNGTTIQTQLGALSIDSSGIPTEPTSPATLVTPGYWVGTDPQ